MGTNSEGWESPSQTEHQSTYKMYTLREFQLKFSALLKANAGKYTENKAAIKNLQILFHRMNNLQTINRHVFSNDFILVSSIYKWENY